MPTPITAPPTEGHWRDLAKVPGTAAHRIARIDSREELRELAQTLRQAFGSMQLQAEHVEAIRSGHVVCEACQEAFCALDFTRACVDYRRWQHDVDAAWRTT